MLQAGEELCLDLLPLGPSLICLPGFSFALLKLFTSDTPLHILQDTRELWLRPLRVCASSSLKQVVGIERSYTATQHKSFGRRTRRCAFNTGIARYSGSERKSINYRDRSHIFPAQGNFCCLKSQVKKEKSVDFQHAAGKCQWLEVARTRWAQWKDDKACGATELSAESLCFERQMTTIKVSHKSLPSATYSPVNQHWSKYSFTAWRFNSKVYF